MNMRTSFTPRTGFTLIELLVVIVVIGSLAGIIIVGIPIFMSKAKTAACASNLRQIGQALKTFAIDHNGYYPPLIRRDQGTMPFGTVAIPQLTEATMISNPWYYELMRTDKAVRYGLDDRTFKCPADKNFDPRREYPSGSAGLQAKLIYMGHNLSYGLNADVKYNPADSTWRGMAYRVNASGSFIDRSNFSARTPSGADRYPDYYRASEVEDARNFILSADSDSEFAEEFNFAITLPMNDNQTYKIGTRHFLVDRPAANILFGDDHVELWASRVPTVSRGNPAADRAKDINQVVNRRYWTLEDD